MNDLRSEITRVRDAYRGQMKFCDIEAFGYFREFVHRLDDVLASADTHPKGGDAVAAPFMGSAIGAAETPNPHSHAEAKQPALSRTDAHAHPSGIRPTSSTGAE